MLTGKIRQTLRALRLVEADPEHMLRVLNQALLQSGRQHRFVTMVVGAISKGDHGRVRLSLATGGHPVPLILRTDRTVEEVPVSGTLIGAVARITVHPATVELAPGETCLLYSDGLTEARGGPSGHEHYGEERLREALASCHGLIAPAAVERVRQLVSDWGARRHPRRHRHAGRPGPVPDAAEPPRWRRAHPVAVRHRRPPRRPAGPAAHMTAFTTNPPRSLDDPGVSGEWHALPVRILGEMLRLDGWRVDFLGANVPGPHLVSHLHQTGPDAVALSCMLPTRLPRAHAASTAARTTGVPVICGGRGFGPDERYAERLGADAWAANAEEAVARLSHDWRPPMSGDPYDMAFLGDDEYTYVVRQRAELLQTAMTRLREAYPQARAYDREEEDHTAEDLGHIVDFLAAALYVSESRVFTDFVDWTAGVLTARGVPAMALAVGLRLYRDQLADYPSAAALLDAGINRLT